MHLSVLHPLCLLPVLEFDSSDLDICCLHPVSVFTLSRLSLEGRELLSLHTTAVVWPAMMQGFTIQAWIGLYRTSMLDMAYHRRAYARS